jgi:hypothetical protein
VDTLASPKLSLDERHVPTPNVGFLTGMLKRVGTETRKNKEMRLDRDQQQHRNGADTEACPSPLTSSSFSPLSGTASVGSFNDVNASWNEQDTLSAFPDTNTNTSGCHHPADSSQNAIYAATDSICPTTVTHTDSTPS